MKGYKELIEELKRNGLSNGGALGHHSGLCDATTDDAVEVVHGQWDEERFAFCNVCSNCGLVIDRTSIKMYSGKFNYCPNCGAMMDEVCE